VSEQPCPSVVGLHPSKQAWFGAADREMQAETVAHLLMKELRALAAGLPTIFQGREEGLRATDSANATPRGNEVALHGWTGRRVG
jgi:hypothetical protein